MASTNGDPFEWDSENKQTAEHSLRQVGDLVFYVPSDSELVPSVPLSSSRIPMDVRALLRRIERVAASGGRLR